MNKTEYDALMAEAVGLTKEVMHLNRDKAKKEDRLREIVDILAKNYKAETVCEGCGQSESLCRCPVYNSQGELQKNEGEVIL